MAIRLPLWFFGALVIITAGVIALSGDPDAKRIQPATGTAVNIGERLLVQPGSHIQPPRRVSYDTDPPTSGKHYNIPGQAPIKWGYYDKAIPPEDWGHNLEHGGVVITL
ncbi:MAG: DUF3105 domain-containing protein [Candidatus Dormibacteraceae bacterium]